MCSYVSSRWCCFTQFITWYLTRNYIQEHIYTALTECVFEVRYLINVYNAKYESVGLITQTDRVGLLYYYYGNIEQLLSNVFQAKII